MNSTDTNIFPIRFPVSGKLDQADILIILSQAREMRNREVRRLLARFPAAVIWLIKAVARWNERYTLRRHLGAMPDYILKDIGIRRDQIEPVVSGGLIRERTISETAVEMPEYQKAA